MKILIVDDMDVNLDLLEARLEGSGYEVISAKNGIEALEILKTDSFDMIISDILMPKMDGYQLCRECKKDDTLRNIPFVYYTATYKDKKDEQFALSLGADRFIVKPMESNSFMEIIEGVLENHKKGLLPPSEIPVEEEGIYFKQYNERLINKLEKKMLDLEREITERKLVEETLLRERDNLRNIFESIEDGIYIVNQQYDIQYVNPVLVKDFGPYEGVKCYRYFHDLDKVCPWCKSQEVFAGKTVRWEWHSFKNERTYDLIDTPMTLTDGTIGKLEIFRDITERRKAEASLRETQATFLTVLDSMAAMVYVGDMETHEILFMNKYMKDSFGADFTGKICWKSFSNESGPCGHCNNDKLLDEEGNPTGVQVWNNKNPATGKWYINYDRAIKWTDGRYVRLQLATDITDLKIMEQQFRQAQKMEAIGTLAGGVAHDFNNILTTIIGNANLVLMEIGKDDTLREEIEEIKIAGERAASLTRQLLAFSRKQVIKPEVMDLNEVINETEKMLKRMIGENIEFQTVLEPDLWKVNMDSGQIDQIIINMAVNSRDAMLQGGKFIIETANVDLDKNFFREHGIDETPSSYVMLAISDTGSGMDKETREHIFEPFFTTKEIGKGTGLGLSTVYGIAKQNNGFIWVYSEPGQGTTFKIYLPKVKESVESEEKERTPVGDLNGSETVFIVEDDDRLRNLARKILERHGYSVLDAEDGEDALRVSEAHEGRIDLMLTDVVMPKMGGKEVAERLQPLYPQMKVIYMSGYTDDVIAHHGVLEPGLNFLEKPFTPEDLARNVREVLDQ